MPKSNSLSGADRYNFMLALTGYLITHRQLPIQEVADHFGVSVPEIRSALGTISISGVGRYRPDELFFLDYDLLEDGIVDLSFAPTLTSVPRLSTKQAAAIASGLSYLATAFDSHDQGEIRNLLDILGKGSGGQAQFSIGVWAEQTDNEFQLVRRAIVEAKVIACYYRNSSGESTRRVIEPLVMESRDAIWYLRGYCHTHQQVRIFRLDRMRDIEITDRPISQAALESEMADEIYSVGAEDIEVLFEVDPEGYSLIADYKPEHEITGSGTQAVSIRIGQLTNLGRIVARYCGHVRVLAPESARQAVANFALSAAGKQPVSLEVD